MSRYKPSGLDPEAVVLRPGDQFFAPDHLEMLTRQGVSYRFDGDTVRLVGPKSDGRVAVITIDRLGVIRKITVDGQEWRFITLPLLPAGDLSPYASDGTDPHADPEEQP